MSRKNVRTWETISRETILDCGKFLKVERHAVRLPDGRVIPDWTWVIAPDAAIVLAVTDDGRFLCFRQTKYAIDGTALAPVGGMLEPGEEPLIAARRELREETGYEAATWISLGSHVLDPNRGVATMHLFLALEARPVAEPNRSSWLTPYWRQRAMISGFLASMIGFMAGSGVARSIP